MARVLTAASVAVILFACNSAPAREKPGMWCANSASTAPGCAILGSIYKANRANDYSFNCLAIRYCSVPKETSADACPDEPAFTKALVDLRRTQGDAAVARLEEVCWARVEPRWDQRAHAARAMSGVPASASTVTGPFSDMELAAWTMARAEAMEPRVRYVLRYENDSLGARSTDSNYTMGLSISAIRDGWPAEGWAQRPLLRLLDGANRSLRIDPDGVDATATTWWRLGSADFTPKRIKVADPQTNDTPYGSLVLFTSGYIEERGPVRFDSFLELGVLGTNVGREAQTAIHKVCCQQNIPRGWDHQIGRGGSATFRYHLQWSRAMLHGEFRGGRVYELRPSAGADLGYYTRALAGATLSLAGSAADLAQVRNGVLAGTETPLPPAEDNPPLNMTQEDTPPPDAGTGFSVWLEYEASAVAYNELLQGAWSGRNDVTFSYSAMEHFVWRSGFGVELTFIERAINPWHARGGRLYFTQQMRSRELVRGREGMHTWGGLYYSWGF